MPCCRAIGLHHILAAVRCHCCCLRRQHVPHPTRRQGRGLRRRMLEHAPALVRELQLPHAWQTRNEAGERMHQKTAALAVHSSQQLHLAIAIAERSHWRLNTSTDRCNQRAAARMQQMLRGSAHPQALKPKAAAKTRAMDVVYFD
eukprot:5268674-Lingulodinium_polyedra.AAC.1